jgi:2-keto-4-pentenoate hydratase
MDINIYNAAGRLRTASENHTPCSPVRQLIGDTDIEKAYAIQNLNHQHLIQNGYEVVGKKIGLTSLAVQNQLGVNQPDFGLLFDFMMVTNGGSIDYTELLQPKAEAEIAFVLKKDLDSEISIQTILDSVDYVVAAIEIVGSRVENWDIRITDTIADNASASHFVLGSEKVSLNDVDLEGCEMVMYKNNEVVSSGLGNACLGNPLNAVLWLAKTMKELGQPMRKNEVILSGALGPMTALNQGDHINATISGFGNVDFKCA